MIRTRIEVPTTALELSTPHFDDETTIVTARPVVPIARAKAAERSRFLLWLLPTALAATIFGGLSALGVNYYERRSRQFPAAQLEIKQGSQTDQTKANEPASVEPEPAAGAMATEAPTPEPESSQTEPAPAGKEVDNSVADKASATIAPVRQPANLSATHSGPGASEKRNDDNAKVTAAMVRKRRVLPIIEPAARAKPREKPVNKRNRGAGRIIDIFEGPNN